MSDLEITWACAVSLGLVRKKKNGHVFFKLSGTETYWAVYEPLRNDSQAMALVKKFGIGIDHRRPGKDENGASLIWNDVMYSATHDDLNRAICECVANMQKATAK